MLQPLLIAQLNAGEIEHSVLHGAKHPLAAACPDALVEAVIRKIAGYYDASETVESLVTEFGA